MVEPSPSGSKPGVGAELRALAAELSGRTPEESSDPTKKRKAEEPKPAAKSRGKLPEANPGSSGKPLEATDSHSAKKAKPLKAETPKGALEPRPSLSDSEEAAESGRKKKKEKKGCKRPKKSSEKKKKKNKKEKSKKHKKKKGRADTSPSGSEPSDSSGSSDEEGSSDSGESLFRFAFRSTGKVSQARLVAWSKAHPGRLASQCMQKMQDRTGREGEQVKWPKGVMPPAATAYYLRVLSLGTAQSSLGTLREKKTLCAVLEQIAHGKVLEAADVLRSPEAEGPGARSGGGGLGLGPVLRAHHAGQGTLVPGDERRTLKREQGSALRLTSTPQPIPWGGWGSSNGGWPGPGASWQGKGWWNPWSQKTYVPAHVEGQRKGQGQGRQEGQDQGQVRDHLRDAAELGARGGQRMESKEGFQFSNRRRTANMADARPKQKGATNIIFV